MSDAQADTAILLKAIACAAQKHSTQRRKGEDASPYINHPIAVTPAELEALFGRTVRKVVEELTDDKGLDKPVRKQRQIEHAPHLSARAKVVKVADKIANVRDVLECPPSTWSVARRIEYLEWTDKVVAGCRGTNLPLEKLYDEVLEKGRAMLGQATR